MNQSKGALASINKYCTYLPHSPPSLVPENKQARQNGEATKKSNIIIKYNQCNSTANCICLSHVATKLLGEAEERVEREDSGGRQLGKGKMHSLVMHFMEESSESSLRSHRLAGHVVNLIWFIFICCAHFLFVSLSLATFHWWQQQAATAEAAAAAVASSKLKRLLLCRRPLGQVYCDGSHKFHFYLQQLNSPPPLAVPLPFLHPLQAMPRAIICLYTVAATVNGCWR